MSAKDTLATKKTPSKKMKLSEDTTVPKVKPSKKTKFSEAWDESDIVFIVEDEFFHCHYSIIMLQSPVFKVMFSGKFKEERSVPVPLPGKEKEGFRLFLELLYPVVHLEYPNCEKETMVKALEYAKEYQVPNVSKHIEIMLCLYYMTLECGDYQEYKRDLLADWKMSEEKGLLKVRKLVYNKLLGLHGIEEMPEFEALDGNTKFKFLAGVIKKSNKGAGRSGNLNNYEKFADEQFESNFDVGKMVRNMMVGLETV